MTSISGRGPLAIYIIALPSINDVRRGTVFWNALPNAPENESVSCRIIWSLHSYSASMNQYYEKANTNLVYCRWPQYSPIYHHPWSFPRLQLSLRPRVHIHHCIWHAGRRISEGPTKKLKSRIFVASDVHVTRFSVAVTTECRALSIQWNNNFLSAVCWSAGRLPSWCVHPPNIQ